MKNRGLSFWLAVGVAVWLTWNLTVPFLQARTSAARSAQRLTGAVRYAYVVSVGSTAEICYAGADGCRIEVITVPAVPIRGDLRLIDQSATSARAVTKAVWQLGEAGWEMIGSGGAYGHETVNGGLHFTRGGSQ